MKSQYFHQSATGRRGFIENGISREKVSDSPCLLGCRLQGLARASCVIRSVTACVLQRGELSKLLA